MAAGSRAKCAENVAATRALAEDAATPLNYYAALRPVAELLGPDTYVVSEGANTMDIGRTMLANLKPRHRWPADCKRCQRNFPVIFAICQQDLIEWQFLRTKPSANKDLCPKIEALSSRQNEKALLSNRRLLQIVYSAKIRYTFIDHRLRNAAESEYSCPRLDAGTFGTMGVGLGFAIATALYVKRFDPGAKVSCDWWRAGHNTRL